MLASDLMTTPVHAVREDATLREAAQLMLDHGIGALPVLDEDGQLVGILTEGDFAAQEHGVPFSTFRAPQVLHRWLGADGVDRLYAAAARTRVRDFMTRRVATVEADAPLSEVVRIMLERRVRRLPVMREGRLVGIVAQHDLLRLVLGQAAQVEAAG